MKAPTRRQQRRSRRDIAVTARPAYYLAPYKRPCETLDPLGALAWDQTEDWMTPQDWLARLRRSGRPYKVWGKLTGNKWVPRSRPCVRAHAHPSSTLMRGYLPDGKYGLWKKSLAP